MYEREMFYAKKVFSVSFHMSGVCTKKFYKWMESKMIAEGEIITKDSLSSSAAQFQRVIAFRKEKKYSWLSC